MNGGISSQSKRRPARSLAPDRWGGGGTPAVATSLNRCRKELCRPTVRRSYGEHADRARRESLSYEQFLLELLEQQRQARRHNRIPRLLRQSKLPLEKSLQICDRLAYHSLIRELNLPSYPLEAAGRASRHEGRETIATDTARASGAGTA